MEKTRTMPFLIALLNCVMPPSSAKVLGRLSNTVFWASQYWFVMELYGARPLMREVGFSKTLPFCL